jgi:hypothetical protein
MVDSGPRFQLVNDDYLPPEPFQDELEMLGRKAPDFDRPTATDYDQEMTTPTREEVEARLETIEVRLDGRLSSMEKMMDAKFAQFETILHKSSADMSKWMLATMVTIIGTMLAAIFGINQIYKGSQPATQAQVAAPSSSPVIIQVPQYLPPPTAPTATK